MKQRNQARFFRIATIFLFLIVFGTAAMSFRTGASFADTVVAITALLGVFALWVESRRGKNIAMGEFIVNINSDFTENPERAAIHQKIIAGERLGPRDKPAIVAYLTFFEIVYRLINSDVIHMDVVDDLFRSRFFRAAHHVDVQDLELLPDADGYRNIYELEQLWLSYLHRSGVELKRGDRPLPASARRRSVDQVRFSFTNATNDDVTKVHDLIVKAAAGLPPQQFFVNDAETIARQMGRGFTVMAYRDQDLAGVLHVYFPTEDESYSRRIGDVHPADHVAHMDIGAVLPDRRGHGLLGLLLIEAEAQLRDRHPERVAYYATVDADNGASRRSFEFSGYNGVQTLQIHGAYTRTLYRKVPG